LKTSKTWVPGRNDLSAASGTKKINQYPRRIPSGGKEYATGFSSKNRKGLPKKGRKKEKNGFFLGAFNVPVSDKKDPPNRPTGPLTRPFGKVPTKKKRSGGKSTRAGGVESRPKQKKKKGKKEGVIQATRTRGKKLFVSITRTKKARIWRKDYRKVLKTEKIRDSTRSWCETFKLGGGKKKMSRGLSPAASTKMR